MVKMSPINLVIALIAIAGTAKAATTLPQTRFQLNNFLASQTQVILAKVDKPEKVETSMVVPAAVDSKIICEAPPEELLLVIRQERDLLATQKNTFADRQASLDLATEKLAIETTNLEELRSKIDELLQSIDRAYTEDVDRLVRLYASMKPGEAANIMDDLDIEVTVMVLGAMKERTAGPILAKMTAIRARAVSKIILERSKLPGDQDYTGLKLN